MGLILITIPALHNCVTRHTSPPTTDNRSYRGRVLSVTRYRVPQGEAATFHQRARAALQVLAARPGHVWGGIGRSTDDPSLWTVTTVWTSVGKYRRALGSYEVKVHAHPLMYLAVDEPTAFEVVTSSDGTGSLLDRASDRAPDAETFDLGDALGISGR